MKNISFTRHSCLLRSVAVSVLFTLYSFFLLNGQVNQSSGLMVGRFDIDVTPPAGSEMAYNPMVNSWDMGLRARGIILTGSVKPVILVSLDWIGIDNESQDVFRAVLAAAGGTVAERVAVHTVHQHDAPACDFSSEKILKKAGLRTGSYESSFQLEALRRLEEAVKKSLLNLQPVTHIGYGQSQVHQVASNRRILGADGRVRDTRYTACADPALRAEPEGLIDPMVSVISFWNNDTPLAVLSYYATHPQSYYRLGIPNPDFPGIARFYRQLAVPDALHVHFNGAGGNIGAGKYNDGSHINRGLLAERLADGMRRAWENTVREPLTGQSVAWDFEPVTLPPSKTVMELKPDILLKDTTLLKANAGKLAWLERYRAGKKINISCLTLGNVRILHMPGELFVEYQLAAKAMRPDLFVAMAAYGDLGTGYIGTAVAYQQGGYEAGASNVAPETENILMAAMRKLLNSRQ